MLKIAGISGILGMLLLFFSENTQHVAELPCLYTQANILNVRASPNLDSEVLTTLPKGTQICIYKSAENDFLQTPLGFLHRGYLSLMPTYNAVSLSNPIVSSKMLLTSTPKGSLEASLQNVLSKARLAIKEQNYTQAKNLALQINTQNPKNIESWEIFARALYFEGKQQEAMLLLENYLFKHYDATLSLLLQEMQNKVL